MNRKEWVEHHRYSKELYILHKKLKQWKLDNDITERCVIHHRDDTPETIEYNENYYERWGFNEDGTFEYGKYVVFMTHVEHVKYHNTGIKRSAETLEKMSRITKSRLQCKEDHPLYGTHLSDETKKKISDKCKERGAWVGEKNPNYGVRKYGKDNPNYGRKLSEEAINKMRQKILARCKVLSFLYNVYKNNGGVLKWQKFCSALSKGDITFEERPISVFL